MVALRNHYGAPLSRRRLYIFLIREDVMTAESLAENFDAVLRDKLTVLLRAFADMEMKVEWFLDWLIIPFNLCIKLHLIVVSNLGESPAQAPRKNLLLPAAHRAVVRDKEARIEARKRNSCKLLGCDPRVTPYISCAGYC